MTAKAKGGAPAIDDETIYSVSLKRPIKVGRSLVRPGAGSITLKGKVIKDHIDDIAELSPVTG